jgi:hypothetical protein
MYVTVIYRSERTPEGRFRPKAELRFLEDGVIVANSIVNKDASLDFATEEEAEARAWLLALLWRDDEMPTFDIRDKKRNFRRAKSAKCALMIRPYSRRSTS